MIRTWRFPGALSVGSSRVSHYASPKARSMMSGRQTTLRPPKEEGSISSIFTSLTGETPAVLPPRFSTLKKEIWRDEMIESWREVLNELEEAVEEVSSRGSEMIPRISYTDIHNGLSKEQIGSVKRTGTIIVKGGVPREEALTWKQSIRYYALANQDSVRGFPADNIQVYELYNSIGQVKARSHPALVETQKFLLSLWHASDPSTASEISLSTPISYFDRLRIRQPGDSKFALGPHIDGGALERWEDPGFRSCFKRILQGGNWRQHDPFDVTPRIHAKQDLYHASNQCSIFRPWQGWTSMSSTGPNEGTLRVLPLLTLSSAYIMLRPFFRPRSAHSTSLNFEDWEVDIDGTSFPGSGMGKTQELNETTHPHLRLDKMVSMPRVEPGDQVYWHCDVVHAVETQHRGLSDSSVLYIPAVPLTLNNASYLRDQRLNFVAGLPAPDFPGGEGESKFVGHASVDDLATQDARRMFGFEKFEDGISKDANFAKKVNSILFG